MFNEDRLRPYIRTLDAIAALIPHGMIAGGFLRDTLLGKPTKDIDLFVDEVPSLRTLDALGELLAREPQSLQLFQTADVDYPADRMLALWKGRAPVLGLEGVDLCLVVPDVLTNLQKFPENISKVWYDTTGLHMTPEFKAGHVRRRIVTTLPLDDRRTQRIAAKYPDYIVTSTTVPEVAGA